MAYYRQPNYFSGFKCVGSTCPNSCCYNWSIDWKTEELNKVKNDPKCSDELRELIEKSFTYNEERKTNVVILKDDRGCPFLTEDSLCRIQLELGAEALSYTCSTYPRNYIISDSAYYRYCNMSCPEVMKKMLYDEKSMELVNVPIKENARLVSDYKNTPEKLKEHPEFKYRGELLELFYEIIGDKKNDVEINIILGALAAHSLEKLVKTEGYDSIPQAIKDIRAQLHNGAQLKKIENIKPNYHVKLGYLSQIVRGVNPVNVMSALTDRTGTLNIDLYLLGEKRLAETFKDNPFYLRNIALNLLLELGLPFKLEDKTIFENYCIFAVAFAAFKLNVIATAELGGRAEANPGVTVVSSDVDAKIVKKVDSEKHVIKSAALISRSLCHNPGVAKNLLELLHKNKLATPGYIALLVK